ncbi:MAG: hypothetical protein FJW80_02535 [Actinobacteria bacterium]|nr:hypothetical protein [Actinomycetota bacterium]
MSDGYAPATVRRWDDRREVVLDDGRVVTLGSDVPLEGFRTLAVGQRVRLRMTGEGIDAITWPVD